MAQTETRIFHKEISPYYPDRCLECPELLMDDYGATHYCKCVDCMEKELELKERLVKVN